MTYFSPAASQELGRPADSILGRPLGSIFDIGGADAGDAQRSLRFLMRARSSISRHPVRLVKEREPSWWEISAKPRLADDGGFEGYRGSAKDVTVEREERQEPRGSPGSTP